MTVAMARTRFIKDRGLTSRMTLVMALMAVLYLAFMALLISQGAGTGFVLVLAAAMAVGQWYFSDKVALAAMRAREVSPQQAPELHGMVDRLCAMADMPKPRVYIADMDMPNAFATGRSPKHSAVCVTTGIMRRINAEELEGVLAHELSHVAHRDVAVMTVASFLGVVAGLITRYALFFGGGNRNNQNGIPFLVIWLVSLVVAAISFADRSGAFLTGKPSALASALTKISGEMARIPTRDLRSNEKMNAFFIAPAVKGASLNSLLATHPPLQQRLDQLAKVSAELGRPM